ncbi:MAG: sensor domain-containing diguanylate cyclase [Candidatus Omnitrophota bacterium]|nr:MAG: sensor domain-containing diguanylate cyclase [Candidatus Omnitrophota bacterium]
MYNILPFTTSILFFLASLVLFFIGKINLFCVFVLTLVLLIAALIVNRFLRKKESQFRSETEHIEEKSNLLKGSIELSKKKMVAMPVRSERMSFLFEVSQKLIELNDSEEILDFLVSVAGALFPQADNILLFLIQEKKDELNLARSLKRKDEVIKEKKGDLVDKWVLRHNQSLMIDDIMRDFRFDYNQVLAFKARDIRSFAISPLSLGETIIGTIRLESKQTSAFSLDDSRILRSICDLGTIVLERANLFKRTEELATRDSLTSLFVRDYFFQRLKEETRRAHLRKSGLGILMLDIDNFKSINDTHGHIVGDLVLKRLAKILMQSVGDSGNIVSRFGGEEFILFMVECKRDELISLGEKIRQDAQKATISYRRKKVDFTISLGAVMYPDDAKDITDLIERVDQLLYQAKRSGKNKLCTAG